MLYKQFLSLFLIDEQSLSGVVSPTEGSQWLGRPSSQLDHAAAQAKNDCCGTGVSIQAANRSQIHKEIKAIERDINNRTEWLKRGTFYNVGLPKDVKVVQVGLGDGTRPERGVYFSTVKSGSWAGTPKISLGCLIES